jgi:hypothetical protein
MGLQGAAFLALWNDVDPARDAEYDDWHTFEHVPERVGIEGFLAARRYVARERSDDRYFTLYDVESFGVFAGPAYAEVVDHPSEWSRSMRPSLHNFHRSPCTMLSTQGTGLAGSIATFRIGVRAPLNAAGLGEVRTALEPCLATSGITSLHLGLADRDAGTRFPLQNVPATDTSAGAAYVLLVEGIDRSELDAAAPRIIEAIVGCVDPMQPVVWKSFDLAIAIDRSNLQHPTTQRQPPRPDLRQRWQVYR